MPAPVSRGWAVAGAAVLAIATLAVLPPVVGGEAGAVLTTAFSAVCHQIADRSPHVAGGPIALCHRCFGVVVGLVVGVFGAPLLGSVRLRWLVTRPMAPWLALAVLPAALDWALGAAGLWTNTAASRLLTGGLFGFVAGVLLGANLLQREVASAIPTSHDTPLAP